jgi:D-alanine--poly(phosphoribitol) ligase subunit 2
MEDRVINIIAEICENETIKDNLDIDLIENEILDSLAFITLISRLEEEFDIEIQPTQVKPDTWRSINSIIELVKSYNE